MKIPGLGTTDYPTKGYTNSGVLFSSLGSFWTKLFGDREAIRGLTIGQSEELIQRYYDYVESLNALSVHRIDELHRNRWLPIRIRKSALRLAPLRFLPAEDPDQASFGAQPLPESTESRNDNLHYGETFQFGRAKRPVEQKYVVAIDPSLKRLPVLADRLVAPEAVLTAGVDFWLQDGNLYFANNPFESDAFLKYELFDDTGKQLTFVWSPEVTTYATQEHESDLGPAAGTIINEEELLLWAYHAQEDVNSLRNNYGVLFGLNEEDPQTYKNILRKTVELLTEGPSIAAVSALASSFLGVQMSEHPEETLVDAYSVDDTWYVITDKQVYKAGTFFNLSDEVFHYDANPANEGVKVGAKLKKGTPLFDAVTYYDNVASPAWWNTAMSRIVLPGSMFLGDYAGVLIFENIQSFVDRGDDNKLRYTPDIVNTIPGELVFPFPPTVTQADQDAFNAYISHPDRYETVRQLIEDSLNISGVLNPLDFVFRHFLKTNTAMLRIKFRTLDQAAKFSHIYHLIKNCLPKYVYVMFDFELALPQETAIFAANTTDTSALCADGSDPTGWVRVPPYYDPPWQVRCGWPTTVLEAKRPFVIAKLLNFVTTYTNGYGTFYQFVNGLTGMNNITFDSIDFSNKYKVGDDAGNIPLAYAKTGSITIAQNGLVVTGSGTKFTSELSVGDMLFSKGDTDEYRVITEITSDTSLKIAAAFSGTTRSINLYVAHATPTMRNTSGLIFWRL